MKRLQCYKFYPFNERPSAGYTKHLDAGGGFGGMGGLGGMGRGMGQQNLPPFLGPIDAPFDPKLLMPEKIN